MQAMLRDSKHDLKLEINREKMDSFQVSFNSWGHITLRWFNREDQSKDVLIILDKCETMELIRFLNRIRLNIYDC